MANELFVGDTGTEFIVTIKDGNQIVSLEFATVMKFKFQRKNRTTFERTATWVTDGIDGQIHYFTTATDLDMAGEWTIQAYIELPDWKGHSDTSVFSVLNPIQVVAAP